MCKTLKSQYTKYAQIQNTHKMKKNKTHTLLFQNYFKKEWKYFEKMVMWETEIYLQLIKCLL